jgi:hypothetical protein
MNSNENPYKLSFGDFAKLASNQNLSAIQKIGFGPGVREGNENEIVEDIVSKLTNFEKSNMSYLDIGPGCSTLPLLLADKVIKHGGSVCFVDSSEMLAEIETDLQIEMIADRFPTKLLSERKFDIILCYSVFHYIYNEIPTNIFLDFAMSLLLPGGQLLVGDIPNLSLRRRFFNSPAGVDFHQKFVGNLSFPELEKESLNDGKINDRVLLDMLCRARDLGFDSYILRQNEKLPMANRREDVLVINKI